MHTFYRVQDSHSPAALARILPLPRMISPTDIESERATPSITQAHNVTPPRSCIIDAEWLNKRIPITPDEIPSAAGEQRGDGRASHRFGWTALVQPTHTRAARKGLSWPANATDLCGLGRRLSACKKISLACAPGDSYASSTHLIQSYTARRSPDRRDGRTSKRASAGKTAREMATRGRKGWCRMNRRERQVGVGRETQCGRGSLRQATRRPTRRIRRSFFFTRVCVDTYTYSSLQFTDFISFFRAPLPPPTRAMRLARSTLFLSSGRVVANGPRRWTGIPSCASVLTYQCPAETRIAPSLPRARKALRGNLETVLQPSRSRDPPLALSLLDRAKRKCALFFKNERGRRATCIRCGYRGELKSR